MTSLIGQTINDRYRLDALLGDGGMGTVYRAFDRNLDRQVAIKLMHSHFARQPEFRKRLIQEAQTAAKLDHPSIVRIYDFGESDLGLFITMEYVDGGSLREHLQRLQTMGKFLPFSQSMQIGIQIAEALDYAHRRGVIHRDVKPGNIILKRLSHPDEPGEQPFRAVLTDFGLVKLQEGIPMTQSGATVGTPAYMSPEQCEGMELDGRSDLYSLGVVLYELVTNRLPFTFQSLADAISTHRRGMRPAPPSEYRNDAPPLIDGLLAKALAKSPDDRFSNGFEMATALRSAKLSLEGTPTRIMTRQELNILDRVENPPEGYELEISAPGHQPSVMSLVHSVVTLGRNADNDVVLPADGVSRHHARLQATSLGWEVLDLGGPNGTWLDDRRLRPQEPTPLLPGAKLRVGPYELELLAPDISASALAADLAAAAAAAGVAAAAATVPGATTRGLPENGSAAALAVYPIQDTIEVDPGKEAEIKLEVINRSELADRVSLRVQGVPTSWITTPSAFVPIQAGETIEMSVVVLPPLNQSTPTGRQRVLVGLVSQRHPDVDASASLNLVVNPVFTFAATMEPQQMRLPGTATISVQNTGSAAGEFSVIARDPQDALEFTGEKGRISIQPGQVAHVNLEVKARESSFFDSDDVYPYEVNVVSRTGGRQQLSAEAIAGGLIPPWLLYALILLTTICCAALAFAAFLNRDRLFPPSATATLPFAGIGATQTAAAMTQTAVAVAGGTQTPTIDATSTIQTATAQAGVELTATWAAATADAQGDSDGDGLSNVQEGFIGTDPFNPDTDGDGLSDGQEVLVEGTDPLRVDTDGDSFSDGNEVLFIGSDPLNPNDPVVTRPTMGPPVRTVPPWVTRTMPPIPTRTMPPIPTRTMPPVPTFTLPPPTPTPTPSITWTPTATATPSITPTPTNTATPTLTPTATDIPIGPVPSISCAVSPPNINGSFDPGEWPASPIAQFSAAANPGFSVQAYLSRNGSNYYLAYLINDPAFDANDTIRTGFDNDASGYDSDTGGYDPDVSDRFFIVNRDGSGEVWAGIGSNTDSLTWDSSYSSSNWNFAVGESAAQWVVEMQIAASELNLQALFGMMSQAQSGTSVATWPGVAYSNDPSTWQPVNNANCP